MRFVRILAAVCVLAIPTSAGSQSRQSGAPPRSAAKNTSPTRAAPTPSAKDNRRIDNRSGTRTDSTERQARNPAAIFAGGAPKTVEDLKAMQAVMQRLSSEITRSTVGVRVGPAQGSGVIVTREGHVLTAAHVAGTPGRDATFILRDGSTVRGKTLGVYYDLDAGLMQITDPGPWHPAPMGDSDKLKVGQWCLGTGHPGGYQRGRNAVLRLGRVLRIEDDGITTDCTLVGGDSGGPLFDMNGRIIGIHSRIGNSLAANVHVPVSTYRENWDRLVKGEAWGSQFGVGPFIGVVGASDATDARIAQVTPGSPADEAGIKPGDVITKLDGNPLSDFASLSRAVRQHEPGDRIKVEVRRDGRTLQLDLVVGGREE